MLWVLKRTVSMRRFFRAPKTYVKTDGCENIYNFTLKNFVCFQTIDETLEADALVKTLKTKRTRKKKEVSDIYKEKKIF